MNLPDLESLKYPIGLFTTKLTFSPEEINTFVQDIASLPTLLKEATTNLTQTDLDTPYRPGGWTVRQTIHHVVDSHINSYTRFRLALTEDKPVIKPYEEHLWAELTDAKTAPIDFSLILLEALHHRWVILLKSLTTAQWQRVFVHPESGETSLGRAAGIYSWHGKHHLAHITQLIKRNFDR